MKIKNIISTLLVSAVAISAMVFPASAEENNMNAYIYVGDTEWACQYWGDGNSENTLTDNLITTAKITGDGSYTVAIDVSDGYRGNETDFITISDICVLGVEIGGNSATEYPNAKITINSITIDGEKATFKDIVTTINEDNPKDKKIRADIYNAYGTKALENVADYKNFSKIEISFTISDIGTMNNDNTSLLEVSSKDTTATTTRAETPTTTTTTAKNEATTPSTGNSGILPLIILAGISTFIASFTRKK